MCPWIILLAYVGIRFLFGYKKGYWNYINLVLLMSICMGFICSYVSGHTFDELTTSMFISLCIGLLIKNNSNRKEAIDD